MLATLYSGKVYFNISVIQFFKMCQWTADVFTGMCQTEESQI